ncbi:SDR family NAD(P)-dependent oxidoreductase [Streptomyces sp. NPDC048305]|uniref:SDR family NAD(P)-dependent oxidoreductase n=1 Tax=Streptomyces sp. NPDC048305 TaxID=3365532 RepID=UPI003718288D
MRQVRGKTVVVTGGATGVGAAIVRRLVAEGANVVIADRDITSAEVLAGGLWPNATAQGLDARSPKQWSGIMRRAQEQFGSVDALVLADTTPARLEANLAGLFHCIRAAVPAMDLISGGSIISVGPPRSRKRLIYKWRVQQPVGFTEHRQGLDGHRNAPQHRLTNAVTFHPSDLKPDAASEPDDIAHIVLRFVTATPETVTEGETVSGVPACKRIPQQRLDSEAQHGG